MGTGFSTRPRFSKFRDQFCGNAVQPSIQFGVGAGGTAPMNVTASKKPSFGGWMGASWPPASDANGGWMFGFTMLALQAAADRPAGWLRMIFGNRLVLM